MDTLQPVSGWWAFKTKNGVYGKDKDCPDVQYDSDAEDYNGELIDHGRLMKLKKAKKRVEEIN